MYIYRMCSSKYAHNALNGKGSFLKSGRWHFRGINMVYTSESRALVILEFITGMGISLLPQIGQLSLISIEVKENIKTTRLSANELPENWRERKQPDRLREIGTNWFLNSKSALLFVPSVSDYKSFNILINPLHPDFKHNIELVEIEDYKFDPNLIIK